MSKVPVRRSGMPQPDSNWRRAFTSPELTRPKVTGLEAARPRDPRRFTLSALLSQALVAFTIEFDNEFEHRFPHRTAASRNAGSDPHVVMP